MKYGPKLSLFIMTVLRILVSKQIVLENTAEPTLLCTFSGEVTKEQVPLTPHRNTEV